MGKTLTRFEDLAGLADTDVVQWKITETTIRTAVITGTVGELRSTLMHCNARERDLLEDVDEVRQPLFDQMAVMDADKLTQDLVGYQFDSITVD